MSEALDYLMKVRPEAMKSYFGFLKEAGRRLDPKTRAIISVITKVDNQTERGFKQYLDRALREGVTPDEILDGLLMAFPTLGFSKIVWAVDRLLELDIPEFRAECLGGTPSWHDVMGEAEVNEGTLATVACDGRNLLVRRTDGKILVYDARCPHQSTQIPLTALEGSVLTCPKHRWKFDVDSGACIENGDRPLSRLETRVEQGRLLAYW